MAIREILIHPDPRLRKNCAPVEIVDETTRALMADMLDTMYDAPGIGLAAPQIGVLKRIVVMDCARDGAPPEPLRLINPEITWRSESLNAHEEGCLSIPDQFGEVERPEKVGLRYIDENGALIERDCEGILATCIQHEIDHLNGKLFIDYLGPVKRSMITNRMKKLKREKARAQEKNA